MTGTGNGKGWKEFKNQKKDSQEGIDNFALVDGLDNHDSSTSVANIFTINFLSGCTEDVRALALIPTFNAPIPRVWIRYCDVYIHGGNTLTYIC